MILQFIKNIFYDAESSMANCDAELVNRRTCDKWSDSGYSLGNGEEVEFYVNKMNERFCDYLVKLCFFFFKGTFLTFCHTIQDFKKIEYALTCYLI